MLKGLIEIQLLKDAHIDFKEQRKFSGRIQISLIMNTCEMQGRNHNRNNRKHLITSAELMSGSGSATDKSVSLGRAHSLPGPYLLETVNQKVEESKKKKKRGERERKKS